jgi:hypothetical protein
VILGKATDKRAQTGMKFLEISLDARLSALGNAVTSLTYSSSVAMFYNPASIGWSEYISNISIGQVKWFADIDYNYASAIYRPAYGRYGIVGLSLVTVNYGDIQQTIRSDNEQGYLDVGTYSPTAMVIGLCYSKTLTNKFSAGANIKYVNENLGVSPMDYSEDGESLILKKNYMEAVAFDFGIIYKTGFKSLTLGMSARNFAKDLTYEEESFELPLNFRCGLSVDILDLINIEKINNTILLSMDFSHPRDYSEQIMTGIEYTFMKIFSLRAGYTFPTDLQGISIGTGVHKDIGRSDFQVDYSFTQFGVLGDIHRFSLQFSFYKNMFKRNRRVK